MISLISIHFNSHSKAFFFFFLCRTTNGFWTLIYKKLFIMCFEIFNNCGAIMCFEIFNNCEAIMATPLDGFH